MRFVHARIAQDGEEYTYRVYMSDSIHNYAQGKYSNYRWVDILDSKADKRSGNEIVEDVMRQSGLTFE